MAKIYLASSWRNPYQPSVVQALRDAGHEVYDYRKPANGDAGFKWKNIDEHWEEWSNEDYIGALNHPVAERGFKNDFDAMVWADVCVLLLPCGRSAHSEAGWMQGAGKPTYVLLTEKQEPELMYKLFSGGVFNNVEDLLMTILRDTGLKNKELPPESQEIVRQLRAKRDAYRKAHPEMMEEWSGSVLTDEEMDKLWKEVIKGTPQKGTSWTESNN